MTAANADAGRIALDRGGESAGFVSRTAAFIVDIVILLGIYYLGYLMVTLVWGPINLERPHFVGIDDLIFAITFGMWMGIYWFVSWAAYGKSLGKSLFGLRIVANKTDGPITPGQAARRIIVYPFSFIFFGLGVFWVIFSKAHRAWHDIAAGTRVVYDWKARPGAMWMAQRDTTQGAGGGTPAQMQPGQTPKQA